MTSSHSRLVLGVPIHHPDHHRPHQQPHLRVRTQVHKHTRLLWEDKGEEIPSTGGAGYKERGGGPQIAKREKKRGDPAGVGRNPWPVHLQQYISINHSTDKCDESDFRLQRENNNIKSSREKETTPCPPPLTPFPRGEARFLSLSHHSIETLRSCGTARSILVPGRWTELSHWCVQLWLPSCSSGGNWSWQGLLYCICAVSLCLLSNATHMLLWSCVCVSDRHNSYERFF